MELNTYDKEALQKINDALLSILPTIVELRAENCSEGVAELVQCLTSNTLEVIATRTKISEMYK